MEAVSKTTFYNLFYMVLNKVVLGCDYLVFSVWEAIRIDWLTPFSLKCGTAVAEYVL